MFVVLMAKKFFLGGPSSFLELAVRDGALEGAAMGLIVLVEIALANVALVADATAEVGEIRRCIKFAVNSSPGTRG